MLTETEVMAAALVEALEEGEINAKQAEKACSVATSMLQSQQCDAATFGRVIARIGNHSALRQWAVKQGFRAKDADRDALAKAVDALLERRKKNLLEAVRTATSPEAKK